MAKIYNADCTKGLAKNAAIQQNIDKVPNELAEKIVPTFETNPFLLKEDITISNDKAVTGTLTCTPDTSRQFYLTGFIAGYNKDAACDSATGNYALTYTSDATGSPLATLIKFPIITLTAQNLIINHTLKDPIKLKIGTGISMSGTFAAGVCLRTLTIYGYYVDNYNA